MSRCDVCHNDYAESFEVTMAGTTHTFDCFECAIHALAPKCSGCGVRVLGHGLQSGKDIFCCKTCAEKKGVKGFTDRLQ